MDKKPSKKRWKQKKESGFKLSDCVNTHELHYYDWDLTFLPVVTLSSRAWFTVPVPLAAIRQGTSQNQRRGDRIKLKAILLRFLLQERPDGAGGANQMSTNGGKKYRITLVRDLQCNGADAVGNDVFPPATGTFPVLSTVYSFATFENAERFQILKDEEVLALRDEYFGDGTDVVPYRRYYIDFAWVGDVIVNYISDTGGTADLTSDNFLVFVATLDNFPATKETVTVSYAGRFLFNQ